MSQGGEAGRDTFQASSSFADMSQIETSSFGFVAVSGRLVLHMAARCRICDIGHELVEV